MKTFEEAWELFFANHPEVLASWGHQNGRMPNCTCALCDPNEELERSNVRVIEGEWR